MLYEFHDVKQYPEEGFRRWFLDDYFDLIIWYDNNQNLIGFQLCYDKNFNEHAITWHKNPQNDNGSYIHTRVDSGDLTFHAKGTPILAADGQFAKLDISQKFKEASQKIEPEIAQFVYQKLLTYQNKD
jgi:hypothetical protein